MFKIKKTSIKNFTMFKRQMELGDPFTLEEASAVSNKWFELKETASDVDRRNPIK